MNKQGSIIQFSAKRFPKKSSNFFHRFIAFLLIYCQFFQVAIAAAPILPSYANSSAEKQLVNNSYYNNSGPFIPLVNYMQTGRLDNMSLTSRQLGLSYPFDLGLNYSDLTGTYANAQYALPLGEQFAFSALGEYGTGQYRFNGTLGYAFSPLGQVKFTAEQFGQRLPFYFDSGEIKSRVRQDAYGLRFQQLFGSQFLQSMDAGGYYAHSYNKELNPVIFTSNNFNCGGFGAGLQCINYRNIAGASIGGADIGLDFLLTPSTLVRGNIYYDNVNYHPTLRAMEG